MMILELPHAAEGVEVQESYTARSMLLERHITEAQLYQGVVNAPVLGKLKEGLHVLQSFRCSYSCSS